MKKILSFLSELNENNNREWFQEHKSAFQEAQNEMYSFLETVIPEIINIDPEVTGIEPKQCLFRIYRDVRFSKDKRPYKTNFGASINRGGRKISAPGYYLHLEPGKSFIGGGIYMPPPPVLKAIRDEIYFNSMEFTAILEAPEFASKLQLMDVDKLKLAPKGFPKDFEHIDLLKYKHYAVGFSVSDEQVLSPGFKELFLDVVRQVYTLNRFLYRAMDNMES
jgi:uncharacterized protein (TIGR02453 family)